MVPTRGSLSTGVPKPIPRRSFNSPAALLVNVRVQMRRGATPCAISQRTRSVRTRVLPEPAPAINTAGLPTGCSTALVCSSFNFILRFQLAHLLFELGVVLLWHVWVTQELDPSVSHAEVALNRWTRRVIRFECFQIATAVGGEFGVER